MRKLVFKNGKSAVQGNGRADLHSERCADEEEQDDEGAVLRQYLWNFYWEAYEPMTSTDLTIYIGAINSNGVAANFITANIRAIAFYQMTLTAPQVLARAVAMAAL